MKRDLATLSTQPINLQQRFDAKETALLSTWRAAAVTLKSATLLNIFWPHEAGRRSSAGSSPFFQ
jgi:hypothetical protein